MDDDVAYMLDTNIFNNLLDGKYPRSILAGRRLMITRVQSAELRKTKNALRRVELLTQLDELNPEVVLAESAAFDVEGAGWGQAKWNDGTGLFQKLQERLQALDRRKRPTLLNQVRDILIAEAAIENRAILLTGDRNLRMVVEEFGGRTVDPTAPLDQ
jgi:predicted nucleic acid-binding protein